MIEFNAGPKQAYSPVDVSSRVVSRDEQLKLELALSEPAKIQVNKTEQAVDVKNVASPEIEAFYKKVSALDNPTGAQISSALQHVFGDDKMMADKALWSALNRAKSEGKTGLSEQLQQLVSADFIGRLQVSPPTSSDELKSELKSEFRLSSRREAVLWEAWGQLKGDPDNAALVDLIRDELGHLIQFNSLMRNMMTKTVRPDLF
ncbi:YopR/YscH family type III secretion effector [Shewanella woodyi]|uniref:YopR/YscH family type III secretion effector n=1 Tax=Shewanella woodyi TaxID=60961 RepID=UPI003749D9A3